MCFEKVMASQTVYNPSKFMQELKTNTIKVQDVLCATAGNTVFSHQCTIPNESDFRGK